MRGLRKGVSGKPYPRLCNARPRLELGTFQSQAVRLYRLHQARPSFFILYLFPKKGKSVIYASFSSPSLCAFLSCHIANTASGVARSDTQNIFLTSMDTASACACALARPSSASSTATCLLGHAVVGIYKGLDEHGDEPGGGKARRDALFVQVVGGHHAGLGCLWADRRLDGLCQRV